MPLNKMDQQQICEMFCNFVIYFCSCTLLQGVHLSGHEVILRPAHHSSIPILDLSLLIVFQCFPIETIIQIITCILTEKQIVFLSSSYALLTIVTEVSFSFINLQQLLIILKQSLTFIRSIVPPKTFRFS